MAKIRLPIFQTFLYVCYFTNVSRAFRFFLSENAKNDSYSSLYVHVYHNLNTVQKVVFFISLNGTQLGFELAENFWLGLAYAEEKSVLALMIQTPRMATRLT